MLPVSLTSLLVHLRRCSRPSKLVHFFKSLLPSWLAAAVLICRQLTIGKLAQATGGWRSYGRLMLALAGMAFLTKGSGFVKLAGIAASIRHFGCGVILVASWLLSKMSWEEVGKEPCFHRRAFLIIAIGTKLIPAKFIAWHGIPLWFRWLMLINYLVHAIGDVSRVIVGREIGKGVTAIAGAILLMAGDITSHPDKTAFLLGLTLNAFAGSIVILATAIKEL